MSKQRRRGQTIQSFFGDKKAQGREGEKDNEARTPASKAPEQTVDWIQAMEERLMKALENQENEKLKQEVLEKKNRIEEQNDKITDLIERNQRYVEQSNLLMEKRNSTLQIATENTQARVLHAEQEKVKLTEELAAVTAQVSSLQLKLTTQQKKETDLQMQLTERLKEASLQEAQISQLQAQVTELQETSEQTQSKFKTEKQSRKQLELKLATLQEELTDLQAEKESLEKTLLERKKKSAQERSQAEEEIDEIRKSHQEELEKYRKLLKQAQVSSDPTAAEQVSLMQAELKSQWEAKCEHLLASAKQEHLQQYQEVCEQRNATQQKLTYLEEKLSGLEHSQGREEKRLSEYQELAEKKQKECVALRSKIDTLIIHYEQRIQELEKQKAQETEHESEAPDTSEKVKTIMNQVFQSLRGEFDLEESYDGRTILKTVMNTIKLETLLLLGPQEPTQESSNEEEEQSQEPLQEHSAPTIPTPTLRTQDREELKQTGDAEQEHKPESPPPKSFETGDGVERRYHGGEISEVEKRLEVPHQLPQGSVRVPSRGIPQPPTSIPPMPPLFGDNVVWEPGCEEHHKSSPSEASDIERLESKKTLQPKSRQAVRHKEGAPLSAEPRPSQEETKPPQKDEEKDCPAGMTRMDTEPAATLKPSRGRLRSGFTGGDKVCLFKAAKSDLLLDDDDEDEASMKGRPPPAFLFGDDDDDDDDLDWLG